MIAIPSIELSDGTCAFEGTATSVSMPPRDDTDDVIGSLVRHGFGRIHVADVSLRLASRPVCHRTVELLSQHPVQIQVCGNVQRPDQVDDLLGAGASYVVIGPAGFVHDEWLDEIFRHHDPGSLIVALDVTSRHIRSQTPGGIPRSANDWVEEVGKYAPAAVLIRAVDDAGRLAPCDFALLEDIVEDAACPVIAAGVVATVRELDALQDRGVAGVLLGHCLQNGQLDPWIVAQDFPA